MGTLMVVTMVEAKLAELRDRPLAPNERKKPSLRLSGTHSQLWARAAENRSTEEDEERRAAWSKEILETYDRLQNASNPAQVLGVPRFAGQEELKLAHRDLITLFDEESILPTEEMELQYKIAEMRAKVESSFQTVLLQEEGFDERSDTVDTNPF